MATISEAMAMAVSHHQAGRLQDAERAYRQILQVDFQHADAWHLLGVIAAQVGNHAAAVDCISRALKTNPSAPEYHCNLGNALTSQGKLDQAMACYRQALTLMPGYADAHNNLGIALKTQGRLDEAVACYRQAVALRPGFANAHYNLGNALRAQGRLDDAVACYRQALALKPEYVDALSNLGNAIKEQGKLDEAVACHRQALALKPGYAEAHNNLGNALKEQGKLEEAMACYRQALALKPGYAEAHSNLGNALKDQGKLEDAAACYRQALALDPENADVFNNLGNALKEQRKLADAVACYRQALALNPEYAEALNNLGTALKDQGQLEEAVACCRQALAFKPGYAEAHYNLGNALKDQGKLEDAVACYRQALALDPENDDAHNNLGNTLQSQGKLEEAVACYRQALALNPDYIDAHSNLVIALQNRTGVTLAELAEEKAEFERRYAVPLCATWRPHDNSRDPDRRLRLGFVSADLGRHPIGYFLIRALEHLDRQQAEIVCYSDRVTEDDLTARFQTVSTTWRKVVGWSDEQLAEQVREDKIDILIAGKRPLVFARKPTPIQITWLGCVGTTGLTAIDYLIADRHEIPVSAEPHYVEQILRMPDGYVCYDPPSYAPPVTSLPALERGFVTFGSFNNPAKLTATVIETWARILQQVPRSRLVLKYLGLSDPVVSGRMADSFSNQGIDVGRVEFLDKSPHEQLLAEYGRIDVALDSFPYSGGLTTCEAMWMGVPVVTCPGETFASRHSLSHLSNVGLTETIARDFDEYVELAVGLANDLERLAAMRSQLRQQVAASPLCDGPRFAANLLDRLREVWRQWVETEPAVAK